jgi:hypothetical protein
LTFLDDQFQLSMYRNRDILLTILRVDIDFYIELEAWRRPPHFVCFPARFLPFNARASSLPLPLWCQGVSLSLERT